MVQLQGLTPPQENWVAIVRLSMIDAPCHGEPNGATHFVDGGNLELYVFDRLDRGRIGWRDCIPRVCNPLERPSLKRGPATNASRRLGNWWLTPVGNMEQDSMAAICRTTGDANALALRIDDRVALS